MENFSYRGKVVKFWRITGEVLASDKRTETHVYSSGGGGNIEGNITGGYGYVSGHISAPKIHSESITSQEFWIKTEDGTERSVQLYNSDIPLRIGQKITLIWADREGIKNRPYIILVNHNANRHWFILNNRTLNQRLELEMLTGKSLFKNIAIISAILVAITYITDSFLYGFGSAGIFIVYKWMAKLNKVNGLCDMLKKHLENLAQFAYKNY